MVLKKMSNVVSPKKENKNKKKKHGKCEET